MLGAALLILAATPVGAAWVQQGDKLVGSHDANLKSLGYSVALSADGNTLAVGAPGSAAVDGGSVGGVRVFVRSGGGWTQQASRLVGTGAVGSYVRQGAAVAISDDGNTILVGGPGDNGGVYYDPNGVGAAWVFTRSGGSWAQQGGKLVGSGISGESSFGQAVALSADGNTALIGAPRYDWYKGAACVFTRSGGVWTQQGSKLAGSSAAGGAWQGVSVALSSSGNTAAIGGYYDSSFMGAAWVFTRSSGVWTQESGKLVGGGADRAPQQGSAVALSGPGTTLIVGGSADNYGGSGGRIGAVWVFTSSGGVWTQEGSKLVSEGSYHLGSHVATTLLGNTLVTNLYDSASAVVFTRSSGVWTQQQILSGAGGVGGPGMAGAAVALSRDALTAVIGNPADNNQTGAAWVFVDDSCEAPSIATPPQSQTIVTGRSALLSVVASGSGPLTYQWYRGASGNTWVPVGSNLSSFTTPVLATTTSYWVRVSNACGQADSTTATIMVVPPVTITTPPVLPSGMYGVPYSHQFEATGGVPGGAVAPPLGRSGSALHVAAAAPASDYNWHVKKGSPPGGVILSASGLLAGTPTESGTFDFTVEATDSVGNSAEQDSTMTVDPCTAASIAAQPQPQIVPSGQSATLAVGAAGTAPLSYQWFQGSPGDTSRPAGDNSASFTTPALTADASFWVRVSSPCGSADSAAVVVRVSGASVRRLGRHIPQTSP